MQRSDVEFGYFVRPEGGPQPGMLLLHDVWGLGDHTRSLADRLCAEGYAVLALDLYRKLPSREIGNPGEFMRALSDPDLVQGIQDGIAFLAGHEACRGRRIGITGFCMGGMYALMAAALCRGLSVSVAYYGLLSHKHGILHAPEGLDPQRKPIEPIDAADRLRCPLLCFYGDHDEFVTAADIEALERRLAQAKQPAEVVIYQGAGHAFMNDTRSDAFRPVIAERAWAHMRDFLARHLAGPRD